MKIAPQSELNFYSDVEVSRPLAFSTKAKLDAYFNSKKVIALADFTTIKKQTSRIRVDLPMSRIQRCNFLSFKNPAFENKIFYARIFDMNYINNECTEVVFGINLWYTFGHDVKIMSGLIEREHLSEWDFQLAEEYPFIRLPEFNTHESLQVSKELEPYDIQYASHQGETDSLGRELMGLHMLEDTFFYEEDGSKTDLIDLPLIMLSMTEPIPPSDVEKDWWQHFLSEFSASYTHVGVRAMFGPLNGLDDPHNLQYNQEFYDAFISPFGMMPPFITCGSNLPLPYNVMFMTHPTFRQLVEHMTIWGATSAIISVYAIPAHMMLAALNILSSVTHGRDTVQVDLTPLYKYMGYNSPIAGEEIESKKLYQFPFSYMRVTTPNGDEKEYHYEEFMRTDDEPLKPTFKLGGNLVSVPRVEIIPKNYKKRGVALDETVGISNFEDNVYEKVSFRAFPQVPYTTDAYVTYLSSIAADLMKSNTLINQNAMSAQATNLEAQSYATDIAGTRQTWETIKDFGKGVVQLATGNIIGGVDSGLTVMEDTAKLNNLAAQQTMIESQQFALQQRQNMMDSSNDLTASNLDPNSVLASDIVLNYANAKDAFAVSDYHPGTVDGVETFEDVSSKDFLLQHVTLRRDILEKYDHYFKAYGYNSGRYGVPRIAEFIQGNTGGKSTPHFSKLEQDHNGKDLYVTYIKTRDIDIYNPYGYNEIDNYIKAMFNGGQQFINGDMLLPGGENNG